MGAIGSSRALQYPELLTRIPNIVVPSPHQRLARRFRVLSSTARRSCLLFALLIVSLVTTAGAQSADTTGDRIHYGDIIDVDFVGGFEFDWRGGLTVDGDLDGLTEAETPISALCKTETDVAREIENAYRKIVRDPKVNVRIVDRSGRALARLYGAVRNPARFKLLRVVRLREILVMAGGLTDAASGEISIFRPAELGCSDETGSAKPASTLLKIKVAEIVAGGVGSDPIILSGDVITVERAPVVYVIGAVNNPRPIYSRAEMTVTRAIATAGGLAREADGKRLSIIRRDGADTRTIDLDLAALKTDASKDVVLQPFDIIDVASRGGGKRKLPSRSEQQGPSSSQSEPPLRIVD